VPKSISRRRIVVISPHSDDGVLSLGAAIASWARGGARVELLTVFALDPGSVATAGGWDRRGGYATEGEAARARREEDRRACAHLGATPRWLPFGSVDYDRHGGEADVRAAVAEAVRGPDEVLLPGFPLSHPDHEWLVRLLADRAAGARRLSFYAEHPYAWRSGGEPTAPAWLDGSPRFERARAGPRDRLAKWRAIREYRSQLPLLGMERSLRRGPLAVALGPEAIAWSGDPGGRPH
jgi:LmbE family N-acetylglucosaminyl deacetylase